MNLKENLLFEIKKNKKYSTISDNIINEEIESYLKKNNLEKITKQDIKEIRKSLHRLYSSYLRGKKSKRNKLLDELSENSDNLDMIKTILMTAVSAKERINYYNEIYQKIFEITSTPKIIVDIGAGLNPISFPYMNLKKLDYYSYDIDNEDIYFLNEFFKIMAPYGVNGKAELINARNIKELEAIPNSDIIFLWKLLDLIDSKKFRSEDIIKLLIKKTKFIVASFATRTIGGKKMQFSNRIGFELMLKRLNLKFNSFKIPNEVFYIISE